MQNHAHILLVGPMGSGKSTLGPALAARLGLAFLDLDAAIVAKAGISIPALFASEGEAGFRDRETQALADALQGAPAVIATGGGAVLREANRKAMQAAGTVVYLHVSPAEQLRRVSGDGNRPLLAGDAPAQRLAELQALREPWYREIADLIVDTSVQTPGQLAAALVLRLPVQTSPSL
ncbi:MAG: shikimate kinase [Xanthomonadaceae bacterium]|nr:shikimate kinase [Xanthomonadaceae bacterium]